jgi:hypothetical protein
MIGAEGQSSRRYFLLWNRQRMSLAVFEIATSSFTSSGENRMVVPSVTRLHLIVTGRDGRRALIEDRTAAIAI